jgi:hypothetical protein
MDAGGINADHAHLALEPNQRLSARGSRPSLADNRRSRVPPGAGLKKSSVGRGRVFEYQNRLPNRYRRYQRLRQERHRLARPQWRHLDLTDGRRLRPGFRPRRISIVRLLAISGLHNLGTTPPRSGNSLKHVPDGRSLLLRGLLAA